MKRVDAMVQCPDCVCVYVCVCVRACVRACVVGRSNRVQDSLSARKFNRMVKEKTEKQSPHHFSLLFSVSVINLLKLKADGDF